MPNKMTLRIIILLLTSIILTSLARHAVYANSVRGPAQISSTLNINVMTNKSVYNVGEGVQIYGNLTLNGSPVPDGLVALEIRDPKSVSFVYRTLPTGTVPTDGWKIEVTKVFPGDDKGNQLYTVKRETSIYIWIFYQNNHNESVYTTLAFTIYDAKGVPMFAIPPIAGLVKPGGPYFSSRQWTVPSDAELGNATIYACAFTQLPHDGGTPHCPEKSETFTITTATATSTVTSTSQSAYLSAIEGNYGSSFTLARKGGRLGNYTVYVASSYNEQQATDTIKFEVILLGDINRDGVVNVKDYILIKKAIGSYPGHPNWNPNADLNNDNVVNVKDFVILKKNIGNSGVY